MIWFSVARAIIRARRAGLLRLRPATAPVSFACLGARCGLCCEVTGGGVVDRTSSSSCGKAALMQATGGRCGALRDGRCSIYSDRPSGCREYPWYNVGGRLFFDSGCPGMKTEIEGRPSVTSIGTIEDYFQLPSLLRRVAIAAVSRW